MNEAHALQHGLVCEVCRGDDVLHRMCRRCAGARERLTMDVVLNEMSDALGIIGEATWRDVIDAAKRTRARAAIAEGLLDAQRKHREASDD